MTTLLVMYVLFGLLLAALAVPLLLDKIPPNGWYGFRVPSTLYNSDLWYKVNRYMARWLLAAGIVTMVGAIGLYFVPGLSVDAYAWLCLLVFAVPFGLGVVLSFQYLRRLQKANV
jgi:uncharacterized membrane protein